MYDVNQNNRNFKLDALFSVKERVALVTGGGSGVGLMATQALATNGAKVYICGRTGEKLDKVAEQYGKDIPGQSSRCRPTPAAKIQSASWCARSRSARKMLVHPH